jgi:hypothetical protein
MYPHRIRLRGPWECETPLGAPPRRLSLPCDWQQLVPAHLRGTVRLSRSFGYPGRLDEEEHVWLCGSGVSGTAEVALNDVKLGAAGVGAFEFEITHLLAQRNRLSIALSAAAPAGPVWNDIVLEIRQAAYLRARACRAAEGVIVQGVVIGPVGPALELYALLNGRHAHYEHIEPDPAGHPFRFTLTGVAVAAPTVRLDLVRVSTSWYAVDLPIEAAPSGAA